MTSRPRNQSPSRPKPSRRPLGTDVGASTRDRILDVALDLFSEQGYDNTSLRDIAQRIGVSKAALYYHFECKSDILFELHLRLHAIADGLLDQLDALPDGGARVAAWPGLMDQLIDAIAGNERLFRLHQRNPGAMRALSENPRHDAANDDLDARRRIVFADPQIPIHLRIRMMCSLGAVIAVASGELGLSGTIPQNAVLDELRVVVREIVASPDAVS